MSETKAQVKEEEESVHVSSSSTWDSETAISSMSMYIFYESAKLPGSIANGKKNGKRKQNLSRGTEYRH